MKYSSQQIKELRSKGFTIRSIQKELGISSPSVVQWHIKHMGKKDLIDKVNGLEAEIEDIKRRLDANGIYH